MYPIHLINNSVYKNKNYFDEKWYSSKYSHIEKTKLK